MKYMLMMNAPGGGPYQIGSWPKQDIQAHIGHMIALNKKLRASGELVGAEGLSGPDQAKLVRAAKDGTPITDGVFPESNSRATGSSTSRARRVPTRLPPKRRQRPDPAARRSTWRSKYAR